MDTPKHQAHGFSPRNLYNPLIPPFLRGIYNPLCSDGNESTLSGFKTLTGVILCKLGISFKKVCLIILLLSSIVPLVKWALLHRLIPFQ